MPSGFCLESVLCGTLQGRVRSIPKVAINFPKALLTDETHREPANPSQGGTWATGRSGWGHCCHSRSYHVMQSSSSERWLQFTRVARLTQKLHYMFWGGGVASLVSHFYLSGNYFNVATEIIALVTMSLLFLLLAISLLV